MQQNSLCIADYNIFLLILAGFQSLERSSSKHFDLLTSISKEKDQPEVPKIFLGFNKLGDPLRTSHLIRSD